MKISKAIREGIVGVGLRALTLASKFILIVYLAKYLSPEKMGVYGIFVATISYALYFLGLDFYAFASRELLALDKKYWAFIIRDQLIFYFVVYAIVLPILSLVFLYEFLQWSYIFWFYLILSLEHLSQESYRLLVVIRRANMANLVLLLRGGAWVYVVVAVMYQNSSFQNLTTVWMGWSVGSCLSVILAGYVIYKDLDWSNLGSKKVDWKWIKRGFKNAMLFFVGTIALRGIFTVDRYFLKLVAGDAAVGVYVFYMGITSSILSFIDAGVVSQQYPKIMSAFNSGLLESYKKLSTTMALHIVAALVVLVAGLLFFIQPVLDFIGKSVYANEIEVFWLLIIANCIICLGYIPYFPLYVRKRDIKILLSSIMGLFAMLLFITNLAPELKTIGVALSMVGSMGVIFIIQLIFAAYERRTSKNSVLVQPTE